MREIISKLLDIAKSVELREGAAIPLKGIMEERFKKQKFKGYSVGGWLDLLVKFLGKRPLNLRAVIEGLSDEDLVAFKSALDSLFGKWEE